MAIQNAQAQITQTVTAWEGILSEPHRFGGVEYRLGRREIGHIHGDSLVDIPFPKRVRDEIIEAGLAQKHHVLPDSGWISFYIRDAGDIEQAVSLLKRSYEIAVQQKIRQTR